MKVNLPVKVKFTCNQLILKWKKLAAILEHAKQKSYKVAVTITLKKSYKLQLFILTFVSGFR